MILSEPSITISIGNSIKWFISGTLIANIVLLSKIVIWVWKYYRRYRNSVYVYIEEHEELVHWYNENHPEQRLIPTGRKSKLLAIHKRDNKNKSSDSSADLTPDDDSGIY
jgi:hypothetical protein